MKFASTGGSRDISHGPPFLLDEERAWMDYSIILLRRKVMKKVYVLAVASTLCSSVLAQDKGANESKDYLKEAVRLEEKYSPDTTAGVSSWLGKYPMSFFTKTRSAKTVGKDRLSVTVKIQYWNWDLKCDAAGNYHSLPSGDSKRKTNLVFITKYGWAENHHIAVGVPVLFNDFDTGTTTNNSSRGLGNLFVFEKWNLIQETETIPAAAVDFWYYLPTGDGDRKLGSDDGAYKITVEISKAWKDFSLHFNPGYAWNETPDSNWSEINAGAWYTKFAKLWPGIEYNYFYKQGHGHSHDLIPGLLWKLPNDSAFKIGPVINLESTCPYRNRVGVVVKLSKKF